MNPKSRTKLFVTVIILILAALAGSAAVSAKPLPNQILHGVVVDGIALGGMTRAEAREVLARAYSPLLQGKLPVKLRDETFFVRVASDDPAESPVLGIDLDATVNAAWIPGHRSGFGNRLALLRSNLGMPLVIRPMMLLDHDALRTVLEEATQKYLKSPTDATLAIAFQGGLASPDPSRLGRSEADASQGGPASPGASQGGSFKVTIGNEVIGEKIDTTAAIRSVLVHPAGLRDAPLVLGVIPNHPSISKTEAEAMRPKIESALGRAPIIFTFEEKHWELAAAELAPLIGLVKQNGRVIVGVGGKKWDAFIGKIASEIDIPVQEAKFNFVDGRVAEFAESHEGNTVDREGVRAALQEVFAGGREAVIALPIKTVQPQYTVENINTLGIRERVGRGVTSFAGSPTNRRKNIALAVKKLNGILIPQGETFSLLSALGTIDAANGWLAELVIKGNRTTPEVGGGLCQIATTVFRAALAAGVPITERQNHSFRVPYYEPPVGMDATIYEPRPDFKFKNDTGTPLLFTAAVTPDVNHLTFELWGKNDGRVASSSVPKIWNVTRPPEKKIIETNALPVGKEVCVEKAHSGADAKFTYTITYADGREVKQDFLSHYRPWRAICLVGTEGAPDISVSDARKVDPAASKPIEQRATSPEPQN